VPFYSGGWNLFAYPIPAERPVVEALRSISGTYSTVYGYDSANRSDPWQVFDASAPEWVNDLTQLEFGRGYWINVSQPVTLQLQVASGEPVSGTAAVAAALTNPVSRRTPPAVYYGTLPAAMSDPITAWIDGKRCGLGRVVLEEQSYVIKVDAADEGATAGCGAPGKRVTFKLGETEVSTVDWDNAAPVKVDLKAAPALESCRELIRNGGFEDSGGWTQAGRLGSSSITATQAASGRRSLLLGGISGGANGR
jgi:hypothetical protein